jgi:hypothetical protein
MGYTFLPQSALRNINRTTTVIAALIAAAGLSTIIYAVPEQRALAWGGGPGFGGCGFGFGGCGGFFGFHKHIIQTISQTNTCFDPSTHTPPTPPPLPPLGKEVARGGNGGSGGAGGTGGEGGAGGTGGEGGQGGKNVGDITSTSKANINQKANGGHAGNANGGDVRIYGNGDDQKAKWIGGSDQQDQNQKAMGNDQNQKAMGNDQNQKAMGNDQNQKAMGNDQNQNSVVCRNTAVNNAGHGFGANGVESQDLGNNVPSQDLGQSG